MQRLSPVSIVRFLHAALCSMAFWSDRLTSSVCGWTHEIMKACWRVVSSFFLLSVSALLWAMLQEVDSSDEKLPMTGRLTPIGGASSDTEYGRRYTDRFDFSLVYLSVEFSVPTRSSMTSLSCLRNRTDWTSHYLHWHVTSLMCNCVFSKWFPLPPLKIAK